MDKKSLSGVEFKDAGHGQVEAVFATLGVKDHDGDVTLKGAFDQDAPVRISAYNHASWGGALPIGKGTIREEGDQVVFRGEFFKTQAAQDTRETLKGLGAMGEWSYGFDVVESEPGNHKGESVRLLKKMKVHEVSPVMLGAGIGTSTRSVKGLEQNTLGEAVEAVIAVIERAERVEALRAEKGLSLTESTRSSLEGLDEAIRRLNGLLSNDTEESKNIEEQAPAETDVDLSAEYLRFLAITQEGANDDEH
ncbi:HK97 family phage prohead protease [Streptomyces sp. NPDC048611]|uniref:HK97 family phage prohead protease n=1 Tax=Streptomyces sp. NPDC048611 TaxID=3155635 RepID=UPI003445B007